MNKRKVLEKLAFNPAEYSAAQRLTFARQGKHHSVLKNDSYVAVVIAVIEACDDSLLKEFVNHHDYRCRIAVARRGYGLETLMLDRNKGVLRAVSDYLKDLTQSGKSFKLVIED